MGGHHEARDGRTVSVWRACWFLITLSRTHFYGEARIKFLDGQVCGKVEAERHYLVEDLPVPTPKEMQAAMRDV